MDAGAKGGVVRRKMNGPGQIALASVTAAVHQTPNASEGLTQSDAGRQDVRGLPKGQFLETDVEDARQRGADQSTVEDESAGPDIEDMPDRLADELFVPVGDDIEGARADEAAREARYAAQPAGTD